MIVQNEIIWEKMKIAYCRKDNKNILLKLGYEVVNTGAEKNKEMERAESHCNGSAGRRVNLPSSFRLS